MTGGRLLAAALLTVGAASLLGGPAGATHDHGHRASGEWELIFPPNDPDVKRGRAKTATLRLRAVAPAQGLQERTKFKWGGWLVGECGKDAKEHYVGTFRRDADSGPVVGCVSSASGGFKAVFQSTKYRVEGGLTGSLPGPIAVGVFPAAPRYVIDARFVKHFPGDGADEEKEEATVRWSVNQLGPTTYDVAWGPLEKGTYRTVGEGLLTLEPAKPHVLGPLLAGRVEPKADPDNPDTNNIVLHSDEGTFGDYDVELAVGRGGYYVDYGGGQKRLELPVTVTKSNHRKCPAGSRGLLVLEDSDRVETDFCRPKGSWFENTAGTHFHTFFYYGKQRVTLRAKVPQPKPPPGPSKLEYTVSFSGSSDGPNNGKTTIEGSGTIRGTTQTAKPVGRMVIRHTDAKQGWTTELEVVRGYFRSEPKVPGDLPEVRFELVGKAVRSDDPERCRRGGLHEVAVRAIGDKIARIEFYCGAHVHFYDSRSNQAHVRATWHVG